MFVRLDTVRRIVSAAREDASLWVTAMWSLTAYAFLLRVPSERLPISIGIGDIMYGQAQHRQAIVHVLEDEIVLCLKRRKNKPLGSRLCARCWCSQCKDTCPVHVLGPWLASLAAEEQPFAAISPAKALQDLRRVLSCLGIADAALFRTHDLRRGHAQDLLLFP